MIDVVKELLANLDLVSVLTGAIVVVLGLLGAKIVGVVKKTETKIDDKLAVAVVEKLVSEGLVKDKVLIDLKKQLGVEDNAGA